jgi:geranylgeranyl pyrophosphate synthase
MAESEYDRNVSALRDRFEHFLADYAARRYPSPTGSDPAVRYVLGTGGKRVRPLFTLLAADALGTDIERALSPAVAVEMVHTYSLVHDDLPCMDDDDMRRGQPTAHRKFGEALALLAGDALLTDAFALLAGAEPCARKFGAPEPEISVPLAPSAEARLAMVRELAGAAGGTGMVRGQALDLHWTARNGASRADLDDIHLHKTGLLLGAATALGAAASGRLDVLGRFRAFGRHIGLAFQIRDDLIDELATTGKTRGKDKDAGKLTYLAMMGEKDAMAAADEHTEAAIAELAIPNCRSERLIAFARTLLYRQS